jgi:hypothetical protein
MQWLPVERNAALCEALRSRDSLPDDRREHSGDPAAAATSWTEGRASLRPSLLATMQTFQTASRGDDTHLVRNASSSPCSSPRYCCFHASLSWTSSPSHVEQWTSQSSKGEPLATVLLYLEIRGNPCSPDSCSYGVRHFTHPLRLYAPGVTAHHAVHSLPSPWLATPGPLSPASANHAASSASRVLSEHSRYDALNTAKGISRRFDRRLSNRVIVGHQARARRSSFAVHPSAGATSRAIVSSRCALYSTPSWLGTVSSTVSAASTA